MTGTAALSLADGRFLARLAADAVYARLTGTRLTTAIPPGSPLHDDGATFVTLERAGALRGCVGTLEPRRPLHRDAVRNAWEAMRDPRLPPVTIDDWPALDVKVSVLSAPQPLVATTRAELAAALRPGVDGLILRCDGRRATFLPAVWAKIPDPDLFLAALLRKGGWATGEWPASLEALRYGSQEYRDPSPRDPITA
ncbi:AmmeMemoRadiSam system protein A [Dactylosporangium vinaceum]|uniref:AmmeMemoRadiSam system protein A n=1 Tax=Dactylosporangium vinaceum TaxID=53362 RepID=A0ABV5M0K8_9ACTN|nr:AmmeMemoRadiSam system protein A [Dactylosporangium vinaceum]UAB97350.1 AmmeMemoRadiSam system protein A [Dactylosporangium vinaceum]